MKCQAPVPGSVVVETSSVPLFRPHAEGGAAVVADVDAGAAAADGHRGGFRARGGGDIHPEAHRLRGVGRRQAAGGGVLHVAAGAVEAQAAVDLAGQPGASCCTVPVLPLPEESLAVVPVSSSNFQYAFRLLSFTVMVMGEETVAKPALSYALAVRREAAAFVFGVAPGDGVGRSGRRADAACCRRRTPPC